MNTRIHTDSHTTTHFHTWPPHPVGGSSCSEFPGLNSEDGTLFGLTKPPCHVPSPWWSVAQSPRQAASAMPRSHSSEPCAETQSPCERQPETQGRPAEPLPLRGYREPGVTPTVAAVARNPILRIVYLLYAQFN